MSTIYYGLKDWERLETDPDSVVERILEDACHEVGESFDAIASRIEWPIRILVYKQQDIGGDTKAELIAIDALESTLESLDETYGDPEGEPTQATVAMEKAALAFGRAVVAEYEPWLCDPTGEVIEYTRERAEHEYGYLKDPRHESGASDS